MQKETKKGETEEHFRNTRNSADRFLQIRVNLAKLLKGPVIIYRLWGVREFWAKHDEI